MSSQNFPSIITSMRSGFSLVELSIVLVILGLLTGGILAGQSLIRAAELRAVNTEFQRYQTAFNAFHDKYLGVPGDLNTATKFFGRMTTDSACLFNAGTTVDAGRGVCDGNGNGQIDTTFGGTGNISEWFSLWRHLTSAGLIEGSYTGRYTSSSATCDAPNAATQNCPSSKLGNAQWQAITWYSYWTPTGPLQDYLIIGRNLSHGAGSGGGVMKAEEAWNIDTKMDDGIGSTGSVRSRESGGTCANYTTGAYLLDVSSQFCNLEFKAKL